MTTEIQVQDQIEKPLSVSQIIENIQLIQEVMKRVMKDKEHYGVIPGCGNKPALLKPGAEKLALTFRLDPQFDETIINLEGAHREYRIKTTIYSITSGRRLGSGVGSACTMETKWRFKGGSKELTGQPVPSEYWNSFKTDKKAAAELIGGEGYSAAKNPATGKWEIAIIGEKVEHDNPADFWNTVYKMAKKRSLIDAILTVTGASDIFTQDVEEMAENGTITPPPASTPNEHYKIAEPPKVQEKVNPENQPTDPVSGENRDQKVEKVPSQTARFLYAKFKNSTITKEKLKEKFGVDSVYELPITLAGLAEEYLDKNIKF